jgi:hypothetical protein
VDQTGILIAKGTLMQPCRCFLIAMTLLAWLSSPTRAHYLFVRILPPAEGGRAAEVYFSELAEAGDPRFIEKLAQTQLWLQQRPGKFESLKVHKASDRLRAWLPYTGSLVVVGECRYGVLARPKQAAFLLRHCPKAIAGNPDELNRMQPHGKLPLEISATIDGDGFHLTVLSNGKPVPNAPLVAIDANLRNVKLSADAEGRATWKPPAPGNYSIYTRLTTKEAGTYQGKDYQEIRDFATIAFTWPLDCKDADPEAVALFEEALEARAMWKDFPGFRAAISGNLDGRPFEGTVAVDAKGKVEFSDSDPTQEASVAGWVQEQLESIVQHRLASPQKPGSRGKPVLRFGETRTDHQLGRLLIFEGGRFASSYRIKDKQIFVVNRHIGDENMTITVLDNDRNAEGRFLPRSYTVQYWDAGTGDLKRTDTVQDRWQRVDRWDLPAKRTATQATKAGLSVRSFTLTNHVLSSGK